MFYLKNCRCCSYTGFAGKTELDQFKVDMIQEAMEDGMKPLFTIFEEKDEEKKVKPSQISNLLTHSFKLITSIDTKCDSIGCDFFILSLF